MTVSKDQAQMLATLAAACSCGHGWEYHGYAGCVECRCRDCGGDHAGTHCRPNQCPDCGRFSAHSWATQPMYTPDGYYERWGGICATHGDWSDSA